MEKEPEKEPEMQADQEIFEKIAQLLSLFGDTTRVRIMAQLLDREHCVSDIALHLQMTNSAISHQLRILKQGRLVKSRKVGKTVFYSLADSHVGSIFSLALEHVQE
ncbi:MAG: metalloregulator ArsR/SmtB family transcription factor [Oscillospiraceae bacterium]|nr:metalloregulator ArsR/SmtB family transcription factor [Oscillospiraceae bacterium]